MDLLEWLLPSPRAVLYLGNVAGAVLLSSAAALLANSVCRRRSGPLRYGLLLLGLVLVLTAPGTVWLAGRAGIGGWRVAVSENRGRVDLPITIPDPMRPTVEIPPRAAMRETEATRPRPAVSPARSPEAAVELRLGSPAEPARPVDELVHRPASARVGLAWWWSLGQGLALVWAVGTAASLVCLLRGFLRLAEFCRGLREPAVDELWHAAARAAAQAGLVAAPRLFVSSHTGTPVTLGLFRPAVVVPDGFVDDLPPDQLHAVLVHEMGHVARRDPWIGLAQRLAAALYWWCPLVHRLNRRLGDLREERCDDYVLCTQGDGASLAEALVALAERAVGQSSLPAAAGLFECRRARERSQALEQRVRRLLSMERNPMIRMNFPCTALLILAGIGMALATSLSHVRAADEDARAAAGRVTESPARPAPPANQNGPGALSIPNGTSGAGEAETEQAKAIAAIEKVGGRIIRDEQVPGQPVTEVVLYGNQYTDAFLEQLKAFPELKLLMLIETRATGAGLMHLKSLSELRSLIVIRPPVSHALLDHLQELRQIQSLSLDSTQLGNDGLQRLAGLSQLKSLTLRQNPVSDLGLTHLAAMPQLETLVLEQTLVTDDGLRHLSALPRLQHLDLSGTRITDAGLVRLAQFTELRALHLVGTKLTDAGLKHLSELPHLVGLTLGATDVTDAGLTHLSEMVQLTRLELEATKITGAGLANLRRMTQLQTLNLATTRGTPITDAGLEHLSGLTQLTSLNLAEAGITDAGLAHLRGMTQLQTLNLYGTKVTEAGLEHLAGLTRLERLDLRGIPLSDAGLAHLRGLSQLRELDLRGALITDAGLRHVSGMSQLQVLNLSDTRVTDAGLEHLRGLTRLDGLTLSNTELTDRGLVHLTGLKQLQGLIADGTQLSDDGLAHLRSLAQLEGLVLANTHVTDAGLAHLRGLTRLKHLDLSDTRVSDAGLKHLRGLTRLRYLSLQKTAVTGSGLVELVELTQLEYLLLSGNTVNAEGVRQLKRALPGARMSLLLTWGWDNPARHAEVHWTPTKMKILAALQDDTRLEFLEAPLAEVADFLGEQHDIPIQIDEPRLRAAGVGRDVPVTRDLRGISLHSALRLTLHQFELTYVIRDDALVITTVEEGQRLAQQGLIDAEEVKREFESNGFFEGGNAKIAAALQDVTRLRFESTPLAKVVDFFRDQHDVRIEFDGRGLAAAGVRPDVPVTADEKHLSLASALDRLLGPLGLRYVVDDEVILITAPEVRRPGGG